MEAARQARRSTSRSRRSHPSFSDLRLAPLSQPQPQPKPVFEPLKAPVSPEDPSIAHAYRTNHASYLSGRSAPNTPGIISRSPSRHRQYGGLSRKATGEEEDAENVEPGYFDYNAYGADVESEQRTPTIGDRGKSKSETGLYKPSPADKKKLALRRLKTQAAQNVRSSPITPLDGSSKRPADDREDWLYHVTSFTNSLLAEGKGQSWISTHSSVTNLHSYASQVHLSNAHYSESEDDTLVPGVTLKPRRTHHGHARLPSSSALNDEPVGSRSPAISTGWGSRFGSRAASRATSRRNSRGAAPRPHLDLTTPGDSSSAAYRFGPVLSPLATRDAAEPPAPNFVDPNVRAEFAATLASVAREQRAREAAQTREGAYFAGASARAGPDDDDENEHSDPDEAEVARLARTPGFGLGGFGILDRLVGLGNFKLDEPRDEEEEDLAQQQPQEQRPRKERAPVSWRRRRSVAPAATSVDAPEGEAGEGWRDAAWLLSVASKVLF